MSGSTQADELAYLEFKSAQGLYAQSVSTLDASRRDEVRRRARRQLAIEKRVLAAPEARRVGVPSEALTAALAAIRGRYPNAGEYHADLRANGLSEPLLADGLRRELMVQAVLDDVAADLPPPSDIDVELFYRLHHDRFLLPERRRASHILITINEAYAENRRDAALARIRDVAQRCAREPGRFGELARACSECPSAANAGLLGELPRGELFPALDDALFALQPGEVSEVVESPLGFHIIRCDAVVAPAVVAFAEVASKVRAILAGNRARARQRAWLKHLLQAATRHRSGAAGRGQASEVRT